MENQVDNSFRSFIARRDPANVGGDQVANSSFLKKYYHSSWNHIGLNPEVSQKISEHLQVQLNRMDQSREAELQLESIAPGDLQKLQE